VTISREEARLVAVGKLTLEEAIKRDRNTGKNKSP
jgi:hypothetical protein